MRSPNSASPGPFVRVRLSGSYMSLMRLSLIAAAAATAAFAAAPAASAYKLAPPGNSAVSQYVENVPGARGNVPSLSIHSHSGSGNSGNSGASGAVAPSTQRALASQGADGARAAALANATAPPGARGESRRHRSAGAASGNGTGGQGPGAGATGSNGATPVSGSVVSPTSAVLKAVTGSATHGLGVLLPAILVLSAIGAGLLAALRRRRAA
jgi:hypothetical protein